MTCISIFLLQTSQFYSSCVECWDGWLTWTVYTPQNQYWTLLSEPMERIKQTRWQHLTGYQGFPLWKNQWERQRQ